MELKSNYPDCPDVARAIVQVIPSLRYFLLVRLRPVDFERLDHVLENFRRRFEFGVGVHVDLGRLLVAVQRTRSR